MTSDDMELRQEWKRFVAEARALAALAGIDPDLMSARDCDRLEALSDPFLHAIGYAEALAGRLPALDERLSPMVARRGSGDHGGTSRRVLSVDDRRSLRTRILADLHAARLHVGMPSGGLPVRRLREPMALTAASLADLERSHEGMLVPDMAIAAGIGRELWETESDTVVELSADIPRGQYLALKIAGDSMEPMLHSGDVVLVRLGSERVVGRVVVARDPDHGYVVKEVGRVTVDAIELRSLNPAFGTLVVPNQPDPILGTVLLRWCTHGVPIPRGGARGRSMS